MVDKGSLKFRFLFFGLDNVIKNVDCSVDSIKTPLSLLALRREVAFQLLVSNNTIETLIIEDLKEMAILPKKNQARLFAYYFSLPILEYNHRATNFIIWFLPQIERQFIHMPCTGCVLIWCEEAFTISDIPQYELDNSDRIQRVAVGVVVKNNKSTDQECLLELEVPISNRKYLRREYFVGMLNTVCHMLHLPRKNGRRWKDDQEIITKKIGSITDLIDVVAIYCKEDSTETNLDLLDLAFPKSNLKQTFVILLYCSPTSGYIVSFDSRYIRNLIKRNI